MCKYMCVHVATVRACVCACTECVIFGYANVLCAVRVDHFYLSFLYGDAALFVDAVGDLL